VTTGQKIIFRFCPKVQ